MHQIAVKILNPESIPHIERMVAFTARVTQSGHKIKSLEDLEALYDKPYKSLKPFCTLPHPTLQKFGTIDIAVVGASRRFLAQITRHQNEIKFMSASLQYSDYSDESDFVIPENISDKKAYLDACKQSMTQYKKLIESGTDNDSAGYLAPQSLRNVLIMSATPYQWKHIINQRICNRNTRETQYVMELIYNELKEFELFQYGVGPFCWFGECKEGKMTCGKPYEFNLQNKVHGVV